MAWRVRQPKVNFRTHRTNGRFVLNYVCPAVAQYICRDKQLLNSIMLRLTMVDDQSY